MKNRIRIARGTSAELGQSTAKAELGVPFYDTINKRLYIGKGTKDTDPMLKDYSEDDCVTSNRIADSNSSVKVGVTPSGALQPSETYVEVKGKDLYVDNNVELAKTKTLYTDIIKSADNTISGRVVSGTISNAVNSDNAIKNSDNSYSGFTQDANNILKANGTETISKRVLIYNNGTKDIFQTGDTITFSQPISANDYVEFIVSPVNFAPRIVCQCKIFNELTYLKGAAEFFYFTQVGTSQGIMTVHVELVSTSAVPAEDQSATQFKINIYSVYISPSSADKVDWGNVDSVYLGKVYKIIE